MRISPLNRVLGAAAGSAVLALTATAQAAPAHHQPHRNHKPAGYTFAVIGDLPYGADQLAQLPGWIDQINAAEPRFTVHLGDIKDGHSRCDDSYYALIRGYFDTFERPLVYTPGDNEWTDCHRVEDGSYHPLGRLARIRAMFFDNPGTTLGQHPMKVRSQARAGLPENVRFRRHRVAFATLHVVGSNDDLQPWDEIGYQHPTEAQLAEERHRMSNAVHLVRRTVARANRHHARAVVFFQQADMFDPTYVPTPDDISAFTPLVQALIGADRRFHGEIYLFNGDSHEYHTDRPLAPGSAWLSRYHVQGSAPGLRRITVDGSDNNVDWLQVRVNRPKAPQVLSWRQVPYQVATP